MTIVAVLAVSAAATCRAQTARDSATALLTRGTNQFNVSRYDSAMMSFQAALALARGRSDRASEGKALHNIGLVYLRIGQPDSALSYDRAALVIRRALGDRGGEAMTLDAIGLEFQRSGQPDSAITYYRSARQLSHAAGDPWEEGASLSNIGSIFDGIGRPDSALAYYREALPLRRTAKDREGEAVTISNIGAVYRRTGQIDSALTYFRVAILRMRALGNRDAEAMLMTNIGTVYDDTGQPDSALVYHRSALPLFRAVGDRSGESATLNNLGMVYRGMRQLDSAIACFRASLPIARALRERFGEATILGNIGLVYLDNRELDSALVNFRRALPLERAVGDRGGEATTLGNIGSIQRRTGHPDSAIASFRLALSLSREAGNRPGEAMMLNNLGAMYNNARQLDSALAVLDSAMVLFARMRVHAGSDANAVAFAELERGTVDLWVRSWLAATTGRIDSNARVPAGTRRPANATIGALGAAERGRAQGLRDLLARAGASAGGQSTDQLWARDTVAGADLAAEAENELAPLRKAHAAALYYYIGDDTLTTWLLSPTGELRLAGNAPVTSDSLAALVALLRTSLGADGALTSMARGGPLEQERVTGRETRPGEAALSRGVEDEVSPEAQVRLRAATRALGALLLPASFAHTVPAGADLVIVPHGVLGLVPFAALTASGDTLPLGARYALRYAPSLRALGAAEARPAGWTVTRGAGTDRALVVGDPAMPSVAGIDGHRVPLRDLPAARTEGEAVARRFGVTALTDRAATETAVRRALPGSRLVHLATHGLAYASEARVRDSYVALAPDAQNDGLLTIGELLDDVPTLTADLVVLSACQTGLGNLRQAEGTVGFQRALLAKGARSVLVSLWSVDDRATALLMERFYSHWLGADGRPARSKGEALRLAQGEVRATAGFASPRYWAAFQLVGAR